MLQWFKFTLECIEAGAVRGLGGGEAHGLLFSLLREVDEGAAEMLHKIDEKPFSLSPLEGKGERRGGYFYLREGEKFSFTVASLTKDMHNLLRKIVALWGQQEVKLGTGVLAARKIVEEIPGGLTYQNLVAKSQPTHNITLEFITPTSFRQRGTQILFPLPEYVLGSLGQRWNDHGPIQLPPDLGLSQILVSRHRIHTQLLHFNRYKIVGFTGICSYQVQRKSPDFVPWLLSVLADFGKFAGVGYKTTMGMGVIRRR